MAVAHAVVIEMRTAVLSFAREQDKLADYLRCANYALLARAAYRNAAPDLGVLLGDLVRADWWFSEFGPITNRTNILNSPLEQVPVVLRRTPSAPSALHFARQVSGVYKLTSRASGLRCRPLGRPAQRLSSVYAAAAGPTYTLVVHKPN
jgi:hypothetical protein